MRPWDRIAACRTSNERFGIRRVLLLAALAALASQGTAWSADDAARPDAVRSIPVLEAPPDELTAEDLDLYWKKATDIEHGALTSEEGRDVEQLSRDLSHASDLFQRVAEAPTGRPSGYWRASRALWLAGEVLPLEDTEAKLDHFDRAMRLADLGIAENPDCGECMLWKFIGMGRSSTTSGMMDAMRALPEMSKLLDRAIELQPTHRDSDDNSTLGNLYYSSAIFYRIVPDWLILKWMTGVRGDKEKALAHSRKALELHPARLDFQIEVGTQMLCLGSSNKRKRALIAEGKVLIEEAIAKVPETEDERREIFFAKQLLETPKKACGYTGDGIVDLDEEQSKMTK